MRVNVTMRSTTTDINSLIKNHPGFKLERARVILDANKITVNDLDLVINILNLLLSKKRKFMLIILPLDLISTRNKSKLKGDEWNCNYGGVSKLILANCVKTDFIPATSLKDFRRKLIVVHPPQEKKANQNQKNDFSDLPKVGPSI